MTVREAKPFALVGCALGFALGSWNLIAFWLNPLDDSVTGMLIVYMPMFVSWCVAGFVAVRRTGRLADAVKAGIVFAFSTFAVFWIANIVRVNLFLDVLRNWPGWQHTVVARYRESGFESFRAFTNYEYLKDAPLKMAVPTAIGAMVASIGGLAGMFGQRSKLTPEKPSL
jgi:ABC-type dipeptide/oligopeptide/nickel transport system permease component